MSIDATNSIRFHLSLNVSDLEQSVRFFEAMLGIIPAKCRKDYAKFELDDPPLVLSLEPVPPNGRGALNHAGFRFPNSEALVASQRRLELAGFQTQREEGVECCYSRQTKFWVYDPDGGLWEFYVLEGDIQHRGAGQASADLLPQVGNCGPVCGDQPTHAVSYEHRMGDKLTLASVDDASLAEVRLRGTFNLSEYGTRISEVLADVWRALQTANPRINSRSTTEWRCADASRPGGRRQICSGRQRTIAGDRQCADDQRNLDDLSRDPLLPPGFRRIERNDDRRSQTAPRPLRAITGRHVQRPVPTSHRRRRANVPSWRATHHPIIRVGNARTQSARQSIRLLRPPVGKRRPLRVALTATRSRPECRVCSRNTELN